MLKLFLLLLAPTALFAAQPEGKGKPKSAQRQEAAQAALTPNRAVPESWIKEAIEPADFFRETEARFQAEKSAKGPELKNPMAQAHAAADKRDDLRQRIYLRDSLAQHLKDKNCVIHRLDGGAGNAKGYILLKDGQPAGS